MEQNHDQPDRLSLVSAHLYGISKSDIYCVFFSPWTRAYLHAQVPIRNMHAQKHTAHTFTHTCWIMLICTHSNLHVLQIFPEIDELKRHQKDIQPCVSFPCWNRSQTYDTQVSQAVSAGRMSSIHSGPARRSRGRKSKCSWTCSVIAVVALVVVVVVAVAVVVMGVPSCNCFSGCTSNRNWCCCGARAKRHQKAWRLRVELQILALYTYVPLATYCWTNYGLLCYRSNQLQS